MEIKKELFEASAKIIGISIEDAIAHHKVLENINSIYVWNSIRGGAAVIMENEDSFLYANSSINFDEHLRAFLSGKRTEPKMFKK
ncbi:hypothetical protein [Pseudobacteroides cellulosolvens]|uniref:Uncharacterized protein n=1 Tax=Pseudobacteroides cellulosolvens ATCC 35603 = DSM 2933 TaxID=398512 RepID=A0A0L6JKI7_9FIRM|nr:hypothetical protein [Pseudobacteroides cellulosolvens]KNY26366.1 hypothetical protein Bccel_1628 [Pseudobacteroides cellulosolvens ATCC 35603 = DSM 2933]